MAKVFSLLVLFLVSALCSPVPLLLWSGQRAFLDDHAEVEEALKFNDIHNTLNKLVNPRFSTRKTSALDSYVYQGYGHPEVLVAFVGATMGSSELALAEGGYSQASSSLQSTLSNAQSVLVAPYVYTEGRSISDDLMRTIATNPQSKVVTAQLDAGHISSSGCNSLLAELQENKNIFSNDVSDLILVKFSSYDAQIGNCVKRVMDAVKSNTDSHLALLSADQPSTQVLMAFNTEELTAAAPPKHLRRSFLQDSSSNSTNSTTGPQYITPTILWGLLLSFFLLFVLWQALYCLLAIETPARFSYQYPVHSLAKEY
jgi:hypothetical protein